MEKYIPESAVRNVIRRAMDGKWTEDGATAHIMALAAASEPAPEPEGLREAASAVFRVLLDDDRDPLSRINRALSILDSALARPAAAEGGASHLRTWRCSCGAEARVPSPMRFRCYGQTCGAFLAADDGEQADG